MLKVTPELQTERLMLREINEEDSQEIVKWRSSSDVYMFMKSPHVITMSEHLEWFRNVYSHSNNLSEWIALEKSTAAKIGVFSVNLLDDTAKIGWLLESSAQRKGYAYEAVKAVMSFIKKYTSVVKIIAEVHKDNLPSKLLAQRLGFELAGKDGNFELYSIGINDFNQN